MYTQRKKICLQGLVDVNDKVDKVINAFVFNMKKIIEINLVIPWNVVIF